MARPSGVRVCSTVLRSRLADQQAGVAQHGGVLAGRGRRDVQPAGHLAGGAAVVAGLQHGGPGPPEQRGQGLPAAVGVPAPAPSPGAGAGRRAGRPGRPAPAAGPGRAARPGYARRRTTAPAAARARPGAAPGCPGSRAPPARRRLPAHGRPQAGQQPLHAAVEQGPGPPRPVRLHRGLDPGPVRRRWPAAVPRHRVGQVAQRLRLAPGQRRAPSAGSALSAASSVRSRCSRSTGVDRTASSPASKPAGLCVRGEEVGEVAARRVEREEQPEPLGGAVRSAGRGHAAPPARHQRVPAAALQQVQAEDQLPDRVRGRGHPGPEDVLAREK